MSSTCCPEAMPPDPQSIPLPVFVSRADVGDHVMHHTQPSPSDDAGSQRGHGQSVERCVRILRTSPPQEVHAFLEDVAGVLLQAELRSAKMSTLGGRLCKSSNSFLRMRKLGLKTVLLCFAKDFRLEGKAPRETACYLHSSIHTSWSMYYEVTISL
eukprot:TRINITY_DN64810_c0_g1_i1.p1 TRINITY_DN64810_c0_g1~~TRINITY_DN64810_c0_g1_i1.p1  ORF type:complete len:156 (-),score=20.45 TRINITY_DN64810_c0_g1_i1:515-982(-)